MICVSIIEKGIDACMEAIEGEPFVEIRLDLNQLQISEIPRLFHSHPKVIATYRPGNLDEKERVQYLLAAIDAGAAYVDIETEAGESVKKEVIAYAKQKGCEVIISYHNYEKTPSSEELNKIVETCYDQGADMAKIATMSNSERDNARILGLFASPKRLVAFGMGEAGKFTRIASLMLGAEFTYAAKNDGKKAAPGQLTKEKMLSILDTWNFKMKKK